MRILITGAFGFLGYHLTQRLVETTQHRVTALDNGLRGRYDEDFKVLWGRHAPRLAVIGPIMPNRLQRFLSCLTFDAVFHLAAWNGTRNFYKHPYNVLRNNCDISFTLLDALLDRQHPTHVIYASSGEVYGGLAQYLSFPTPEDCPVGFDKPANPRWSYGLSKLLGEMALPYARQKYQELDYTVCRLYNLYGPRMGHDHVIPNLLFALWDAEARGDATWAIRNGTDTRSFCYIDDVVDALLKVLNTPVARNETINIGNPEEVSICHLAERLLPYGAHSSYEPVKNPLRIVNVGTQDAGSTPRRVPDVSKAQHLLGWTAQTPLCQGLIPTVAWCREEYRRRTPPCPVIV